MHALTAVMVYNVILNGIIYSDNWMDYDANHLCVYVICTTSGAS